MDRVIEEFRMLALKRWKYQNRGNSKVGNKCYDELRQIYFALEGSNRLAELAILLDDANDEVRFEAAQNLLPHYTEKAQMVLASIAPKYGLLAFEAQETLKWWRKKTGQTDTIL